MTLSRSPQSPRTRGHRVWKASIRGRQVLIHARSWPTAQRTLNLITASLYLFNSAPPMEEWDNPLIAYNELEPLFDDPDIRRVSIGRSFSTTNIRIACAIAAKASKNKRFVYGITKYNFSVNLHSQWHVDLEPFSAPHLPVSSFPNDHVEFAYAIVSAYSVLEDIGLEVRASTEKPSKINGKWNPVVRNDLEGRLRNAGINLAEPLLWTVRGSVRKLERKREIPHISKAPWARGVVRDSEVELVDAIAQADWLRDRVASHNIKELTKSLNPYDVINVQHLARRLLLESLGFWRYSSVREKSQKPSSRILSLRDRC